MSETFHYMELQILSRDQRGTYVEWHDGVRERIFNPIDRPLLKHPIGSRLGVQVRLDNYAKVCCVHGRDIRILS